MLRKLKILMLLVLSLSLIFSTNVIANQNKKIIFKDKNLELALKKAYKWEDDFTEDKARELSKNNWYVELNDSNISNLEGLQYFSNLETVILSGNNLNDLKPLSKLNKLNILEINNNSIKGKRFENMLKSMGVINDLMWLELENNGIVNISFLDKISTTTNLTKINLNDNKIEDISLLKKYKNLKMIAFTNNRIKDVEDLKSLKKLKQYIGLNDNLILDYKPIKSMLDYIADSMDHETGFHRYDFYKNPVNFKLNGKIIKFEHLTTYYKYQPYAEAIPFFKAIGGSATYNKEKGILTCKYQDKVLIMKDFSKTYTLNGKEKKLNYQMRRMQYDLAYIPIKDICEILGFNYKVVEKRDVFYETAPKLVEINFVAELG